VLQGTEARCHDVVVISFWAACVVRQRYSKSICLVVDAMSTMGHKRLSVWYLAWFGGWTLILLYFK